MTTYHSDKEVCESHEEGTTVIHYEDRPCPLCVQIERYERLKKQYLQVKDQLEIAEQPTRD
jgi:hypothetical protein